MEHEFSTNSCSINHFHQQNFNDYAHFPRYYMVEHSRSLNIISFSNVRLSQYEHCWWHSLTKHFRQQNSTTTEEGISYRRGDSTSRRKIITFRTFLGQFLIGQIFSTARSLYASFKMLFTCTLSQYQFIGTFLLIPVRSRILLLHFSFFGSK